MYERKRKEEVMVERKKIAGKERSKYQKNEKEIGREIQRK